MLLQTLQEVFQLRLNWFLRNRYTGILGGGVWIWIVRLVVFCFEIEVGMSLGDEVLDDSLDGVLVRKAVDLVVVDEVLGGRRAQSNRRVVAPVVY